MRGSEQVIPDLPSLISRRLPSNGFSDNEMATNLESGDAKSTYANLHEWMRMNDCGHMCMCVAQWIKSRKALGVSMGGLKIDRRRHCH